MKPHKHTLLMSAGKLAALTTKQIDKIAEEKRAEILLVPDDDYPIAEFIEFLTDYKGQFTNYIAPTDGSLDAMLAAKLTPIPVHHYGDTEQRLDALFKITDYVALGGLKRPHHNGITKSYVVKKMEWAKGGYVHWLDYDDAPMIAAIKPYSANVVNRSAGTLGKRMELYIGNGLMLGFDFQLMHERKLWLKPDILHTVQRYGGTTKELIDEEQWNPKSKLARLPLLSWLDYSRDIRQTHGTRLHVPVNPILFPRVREAITFLDALHK